ncbi:hemerythrin domain-containing protein [Paenibacillus sp. y28]|uniref:hemerythrin domain-containing protein n=1 Tax=Paenibacillus sp. y28 TaxID=3129110 RepID=UPI003016137B
MPLTLDSFDSARQMAVAFPEAASLASPSEVWHEASVCALIHYITDTHHAYLHAELPHLSQSLIQLARGQGEQNGLLCQLNRTFHLLKDELEEHLRQEEEAVFPTIIRFASCRSPAPSLIAMNITVVHELETDHRHLIALLRELRQVTKHYTPEPDSCRQYVQILRRLQCLEADLLEHLHLENDILIPRVVQKALN